MNEEVVPVPTERELKAFNLADPTIAVLVARAQQSDAADRELTIGQAVRKYKKAVFWVLLLSIARIRRRGRKYFPQSLSYLGSSYNVLCS